VTVEDRSDFGRDRLTKVTVDAQTNIPMNLDCISLVGESTGEQLTTSSDSSNATLLVLFKSSALFMKNLTALHGKTRNLHLDELRRHIEFLIMQLMYLLQMGLPQTRERWSNIAPILVKGVQSGWQQIKIGWLNFFQTIERELALELEGVSMDLDWAGSARKRWKEQEFVLKNHGRLLHSVVSKLWKKGIKDNTDHEG
jgi:hypothetical protein